MPSLLAGVLLDSSCQLKRRRVVEWRLLFSRGGESQQWKGGRTWRCSRRSSSSSRMSEDTTVAGGPAGAKVEAAYYLHPSLSACFVKESRRGNSGQTAWRGINTPRFCELIKLPPATQRDESCVSGRTCGRLRHRCHVKRGGTRVWVWIVEPRVGEQTQWKFWCGRWDDGAAERCQRFDSKKKEKKSNSGCKVRVSQRNTRKCLCQSPCVIDINKGLFIFH